MNLTLVFSRKCRWPEHYFSVWCLRNSQKLLTTNFQSVKYFLQSMNISFCNLRFDLFLIIAKEVNQIRNNVVCVVARLAFVLLCTHYRPLQCFSTYFRKLKEIGVLRPIFPDYVLSYEYVLNEPFCKWIPSWKICKIISHMALKIPLRKGNLGINKLWLGKCKR